MSIKQTVVRAEYNIRFWQLDNCDTWCWRMVYMTNIWSTTYVKPNIYLSLYHIIMVPWGQHGLRVWTVCCSRRCPDAALPEYTQYTFLLLLTQPWVNNSEETVKLWLLSKGNTLTSQLCTNNVASRNARWLTAFSTQCGEGFTFFPPPFTIHVVQAYNWKCTTGSMLYWGHLATRPHFVILGVL